MIKKLVVTVITMTMTASLFGGGIKDDYMKTVEDIENAKDTPEQKKAQLEQTLTSALQRALLRYHDLEGYKEAKLGEGDYEQSEEDPFKYYFRYENFLGYFVFRNDPSKINSYPIQTSIIQKPGTENHDKDENKDSEDKSENQ